MMQALGRRGFLRSLAALPIAAKGVATQAQAALSGIQFGPMGGGTGLGGGANPHPSSCTPPSNFNETTAMRGALKIPALRDEITAALFEEHRSVGQIDQDIAVHKSFSLAAKVAWQRQRNVERSIQWRCGSSPYMTMFEVLKKFTSPFG